MGFINLIAATKLGDAIGKLIYNVLFSWIQSWSDSWGLVGAFSVTVIMFTIFLKILVSPFDFWQKQLTRSNAKKMEQMKPQLEKITKQCGANKELLMQKQRALYKQYKYSTFGACLPMIITLAIFFIVFGGFNSAVRIHNKTIYENMEAVYDTTYYETLYGDDYFQLTDEEKSARVTATKSSLSEEEQIAKKNEATAKAEEAVVNNYEGESFFWIKNIFVADNWKKPIPSASEFTGTGLGSSGVTDVDAGKYEIVMKPLMEKYNGGWNGYLVLPILVLIVNVATMFLNKQPQQPPVAGQSEEQAKAQQTQMKIMQFIMPVMMLVFALFYSSAFTLYMFVNAIMTTIFNLIFNIITKRKDAREKDKMLSTTVKK